MDATTEGSETTETVATADKVDTTTEGSETTETVATAGKVDATTEGSETTEVVPANRNTMTGHARSAKTQTLHDEQCVTDAKNHVQLEVEVANAETIATITTEEATTDDRAVETTVDTKTIEVDNANSLEPSTTTIGHARSATTRISRSETYVTDAKNLALAVEVEVAVDRETTTDDKADRATISALPTVAIDDKADETTEDSGTIGTVATDDKADEIIEDSETTETVETDDRVDETTEDIKTTETAATVGKVDETTEDSETTEAATTDDKVDETTEDIKTTGTETIDDKVDATTEDSAAVVVNGTAVAKATTVQPAVVGNEMDDLSEVLQTTTFAEPRGSVRAMPTTDHLVISELHANLNEKTSDWMWPRERRITLPQRP